MRSGGFKNRGKPLGRRAALRRSKKGLKKTPLSPGKQGQLERKAIARAAGLRKRSPETANFYRDKRVPFVQVQLQRYPFCEVESLGLVDGSDSCTKRTQVVHETWTRGRQGSKPANAYLVYRTPPEGATEEERAAVWEQNRRQFLMLCDRCHDWIHHHPKDAAETFVTREGVSIRLLRRNLEE